MNAKDAFSSCVEKISKASTLNSLTKSSFVSYLISLNEVKENILFFVVSPNESKLKYKYGKKPKNKKEQQLIHIVKKGDGTIIEFWVDPFEDEIDIDFKFSKPLNSGGYEFLDEDENLNEIKTSKVEKIEENKNSETQSNNQSRMELYLTSYEKAQKYVYMKKYINALDEINKAIAIMPNVPQPYSLRGSIYYKMENYSNALKSWNKALELNPNQPQVKKSIEQLKAMK